MKINIGEITVPVKDLVNIEKWKSILLLVLITGFTLSEIYLLKKIIQIIDVVDFKNPFSSQISNLISKTIYVLILLGACSILLGIFASLILEREKGIFFALDGSEINFFIFAGILYVVGKIYNKGVELQTENDLTI